MTKLSEDQLAALEFAGKTAAEDIAAYTSPRGSPTYDDRRIGRMMAREDWVALAPDAVAELRSLRFQLDEMQKERRSSADIERQTAEAIAAWLNEIQIDVTSQRDVLYAPSSPKKIAPLTSLITNGAWRKKRA